MSCEELSHQADDAMDWMLAVVCLLYVRDYQVDMVLESIPTFSLQLRN
jgi:hypothetical protein